MCQPRLQTARHSHGELHKDILWRRDLPQPVFYLPPGYAKEERVRGEAINREKVESACYHTMKARYGLRHDQDSFKAMAATKERNPKDGLVLLVGINALEHSQPTGKLY